MRRRLFNFAAIMSLLLCLATVGLWVRSYWVQDTACGTDSRRWCVYGFSVKGGFCVGWTYGGPYIAREIAPAWEIGPNGGWTHGTTKRLWSYRDTGVPLDRSIEWRAWGFGLLGGTMNGAVERMVLMPFWALSLLFAIAPVCWVVRAIRKRCQVKFGHCSACGYNLTGNTSGVCPECGTPVAGKVVKA